MRSLGLGRWIIPCLLVVIIDVVVYMTGGGPLSVLLQQAEVMVHSQSSCKQSWPTIGNGMICVGVPGQKGACNVGLLRNCSLFMTGGYEFSNKGKAL